jgi:hypothetical protein
MRKPVIDSVGSKFRQRRCQYDEMRLAFSIASYGMCGDSKFRNPTVSKALGF